MGESLKDQYAAIRSEALALIESAEKDGKKDLSDEEQGKLSEMLEKAEGLKAQMEKADRDAELFAKISGLPEVKSDDPTPSPVIGVRAAGGYKTLGQIFVESDEYQALLKSYPNGFSERQDIRMNPVMVGKTAFGQKDLLFVGDNEGATPAAATIPAVPPDFRGIVQPTFAPLMFRDVVSHGSTQSDLVEYVREIRSGRDLNADVVPEATSTAGSGYTAAAKPESTVQFERASAPVVTIAHYVPVTRKALSDVGQARALIDAFLTFGIDDTLEDQMLNGNGSGDMDGLTNDSDLTQVNFATDAITSIRKAKTALWEIGVQPNAILVSPSDDESFDLAKDGVERYYGQGPFGTGPNTLWGIPRIFSRHVDDGTAYVGDFRTCILYDREATTITTGTINDQFTHNMLTLLAEARYAFTVQEPFKIAQVDISAS